MSFYIVLTGKSSPLTCQLSKPYRLRGDWEVAVTSSIINGVKSEKMLNEVQIAKIESREIENKPNMYWTLCDITDYTYVNSIPTQLVDIMIPDVKKNIRPMYVKVIKKSFSSINIELKQDITKEDEDPIDIDI